MLIRLLASSSLLVQLEKVHEVWDLEKTGILPGPSLNDINYIIYIQWNQPSPEHT